MPNNAKTVLIKLMGKAVDTDQWIFTNFVQLPAM